MKISIGRTLVLPNISYPETANNAAPSRDSVCWVQCATWIAAFIGVALQVWQYAAGTSLWLDELAVAQNVVTRPVRELLFSPLAWDQVAPKGFLLAEKLAVTLLGPNEYALRLFPLLCSVAGLLVFARVAGRVLGDAAPIAVALFATAGPLIAYAATVKQYSSDVAAAVLLLWVAVELQWRERSVGEAHRVGLIGAITVWFSQPAVLVAGGIGGALLVIACCKRDRKAGSWLLPLLLWWGGSAAASTAVSFATVTTRTRHSIAATYELWKLGMPPYSLSQALLWPVHRLVALLAPGSQSSLGYPFADLYLLLAFFGAYILFRRSWPVALLIFAPIVAAISVAALRLYPFSDRLILFLLPGFFLGTAVAIDWIRGRVSRSSPPLAVATALLLTVPAIFPILKRPPPYRIDPIKPALSYLEQHRLPNDSIYIYYDTIPAMSFYAHRFGLAPQDYTLGACHGGKARSYFIELDRYRGQRRVWFLILTAHTGPHLQDAIIRYLDTIGHRLDTFVARSQTINGLRSPAVLYLYDLGDRERLNASSASSFPIHETEDPISCDIGPIAMTKNPQMLHF